MRTQEARLQRRLAKLRLEMDVMAGDGNCMFRSISHELWGTPRFHPNIRRKAVRWMKCVSLCVEHCSFYDVQQHGLCCGAWGLVQLCGIICKIPVRKLTSASSSRYFCHCVDVTSIC